MEKVAFGHSKQKGQLPSPGNITAQIISKTLQSAGRGLNFNLSLSES